MNNPRYIRRAAFIGVLAILLLLQPAFAFDLPNNFENIQVINNLNAPDALAFSPDGRMFISERITGKLRVAVYNSTTDEWVLQTEPFHTFDIPKDSNGNPEARRSAGLRGIAFDPAFASNGFVYAFYMKNGSFQNRVVRIKAHDGNPNQSDPNFGINGEQLLIELPFNSNGASGSHNGGALEFGSDEKLYISTGDGWTGPNAGDPVQSLSSYTGKILRINKDGSIPTDNPFYSQTSGTYRAIYALGLRNPYSMSRHPDTNMLYINEARGTQKADIYIVQAGANYGHEGSGIGTRVYPWANASEAGGQLITGGAWYPQGGPFPSTYHGAYFTALWGSNNESKGRITYIRSNSDTTVANFEQNVGIVGSNGLPVKPVMTKIGPEGNLYYLLTTYSTNSGAVHMVRSSTQGTVATPTLSPNGGTFDVAQTVEISTSTADATIRYTLDGSQPTPSSPIYSGPFSISTDTIVKARAFKSGMNASSTASASFTFSSGGVNQPPIANAGSDATVQVGQVVTLDGSGSSDPDGDDNLMYDELWTQLDGPSVTIVDGTEEVAYFTPSEPGTYEFQFRIRDIEGAAGTDTVTFTVIPISTCNASGSGIVANSGIEDGTAPWTFYSNGNASLQSDSDAYECDASARISIQDSGSNVQFYQTNIALQPNTAYRLQFAAKSNNGQDVSLYLHKHSGGSNYGINNVEFNLTENWQLFEHDFVSTNSTPISDGRLRFWLAPYDIPGTVFWFDDITIEPIVPLSVDVFATDVQIDGSQVTLEWSTFDEERLLGFGIVRQIDGEEPAQVTKALIEAIAGGVPIGFDYRFMDEVDRRAGTVNYRLQIFYRNGTMREIRLGAAPRQESLFLPIVQDSTQRATQ